MASWTDLFSFLVTTLCFVGAILGILYAARSIAAQWQSVKTSLQDRGVTLSSEGVSFKTRGRLDREGYVDATQRGFVKVLGAASVGPETHKRAFLPEHRSTSGERATQAH